MKVQQLSELVGPLFEAAVDKSYDPVEYVGLIDGMTTWKSNQEYYYLNKQSSEILILKNSPGSEVGLKIKDDYFVLRTSLRYVTASRFYDNISQGFLEIANIINSMISVAYKVYGPRIESLSFKNPDNETDLYIRETQYSPNFEIRLYGKLKSVKLETEVINATINGI